MLRGASVVTEPCPLSPAPHLGPSSRDKLAAARDVQVLLHANVTEIVTDENARHVHGVRIATLNGKSHTAFARFVVLAAGGVENARLLLLSDDVQKEGLGNHSDFVGRCFMEHPRFAWGRISGENIAPFLHLYDPGNVVRQRVIGADIGTKSLLVGAGVALSEAAQRSEELLGARSWILPAPFAAEGKGGSEMKELVFWLKKKRIPSDLRRRTSAILSDLPNAAAAIYTHLAAKLRPARQWQFVTVLEQEPNRDSRVTLDPSVDRLGLRRVRLDWRLGPLTRKTLNRTTELFVAEMRSLGLRCSIDGSDGKSAPDIDNPRWVWHHMGTTRMSETPQDGVVDKNCRIHGMENLFIAGSSVFPTVGNDMPTLTVVTLAHRLADHLKLLLARSDSDLQTCSASESKARIGVQARV
jgi:choline dehydrogenase-like flavoprotein